MKFNMARLVTRVTSKNFCVTEPSFELEAVKGEGGTPLIKVSEGQCSINGMDIIVTTSIRIAPPDSTGHYYLAFKLHRDSSNNVLADLVYGVTTTFKGLYLTYYTEKVEDDPDRFYLGELDWDGNEFSNIKEDLDKYGRIWAKDILCKLDDPKHPDITRIILQDWIYKVPDWYVSKEGDVEYGAIEFLPSRTGIQQYGVKIQATDDQNSYIRIKAPSVSEGDKIELIVHSDNNGLEVDLGGSKLTCLKSNSFDLHYNTPNSIYVTSEETVKISGADSAAELSL